MRKIGLIISGMIAGFGIIFSSMFFITMLDSTQDNGWFVYLPFLFTLIYLIIFIKILMNVEFNKTPKITLHLLVWSSLLGVIIPGLYAMVMGMLDIIKPMYPDPGWGIMYLMFISILGAMLSLVLTLIGLVVDSILNKSKWLNYFL